MVRLEVRESLTAGTVQTSIAEAPDELGPHGADLPKTLNAR